ncbi:hypothetical protein [Altererythrobacter sp. Root672]|uniref:hypothetical protein n=1 Tax=Altererythrobacter sp. Root672 TaxID=1736584 RepID=UPI0006F472A2|nr:hypothetical protein [Altererythrobacter sp. Root672]KRA83457.1 hypothetical protein ASD76_05265 [Altererythrobacter sp. Root672]
MSDAPIAGQTDDSNAHALRDELARGDATLVRARSVLLNLLQIEGQDLFSDEVVARIRGMSLDVAAQVLAAEHDETSEAGHDPLRQDALALALVQDPAFLAHVHTLVLEAQLAERLQFRSGLDPVTPALIQDLMASGNPEKAALAMAVLAAQARFMQQYRRMELPIGELPGDLFHRALMLGRINPDVTGDGERTLRAAYDEGAGRLSLLTRLLVGLAEQADRALAVDQAGVSAFATALAYRSDQDRSLAVVSMVDRQPARLSLALRVAGLSAREVRMQLLSLHPEAAMPAGVETMPAEIAALLLSAPRASAAF